MKEGKRLAFGSMRLLCCAGQLTSKLEEEHLLAFVLLATDFRKDGSGFMAGQVLARKLNDLLVVLYRIQEGFGSNQTNVSDTHSLDSDFRTVDRDVKAILDLKQSSLSVVFKKVGRSDDGADQLVLLLENILLDFILVVEFRKFGAASVTNRREHKVFYALCNSCISCVLTLRHFFLFPNNNKLELALVAR